MALRLEAAASASNTRVAGYGDAAATAMAHLPRSLMPAQLILAMSSVNIDSHGRGWLLLPYPCRSARTMNYRAPRGRY